MKKILCFLAIGLFMAPAIAQTTKPNGKPQPEQEEKDSVKVTTLRVVSILSGATGWMKANTGKWISSVNRIPFEDPDFNHEFYEKNLIGTENFKQIRVHEMKVANKSYYAIIVLHTKGYYADVEKQENWKYFTGADYYLVDKKDFKKVYNDSLKFDQPYTASLHSYYSGTVPYKSDALIGPRIGKDINTNLRTRHLYDTTVFTYFQFVVNPVKDKRGTFARFNLSLAYENSGTEPAEADYSVFESQYYEVPMAKFKTFAKPK
jgi:hypothetical protein